MRPLKPSSDIARDFAHHLVLERGLADNTARGYMVDVGHLLVFVESRGLTLDHVTRDDIHTLLCDLHDLGISARSQARFIAGIRSFFKFLRLEGYIEADPTELIESPRIGRSLPDVLSVEEIDAMIAALPADKEETPRNHAIIETLYGSGLRVSELVALPSTQITSRLLERLSILALSLSITVMSWPSAVRMSATE